METMTVESLADGVTKVNFAGRLDILATQTIDMQFNLLTGNKRKVIIDLDQVSFLASIGIRTIVMGAKTIKSKGGQMVLFRPSPDVEKVLISNEIDTIIPILRDLDSAVAAVSA